MYFPRVLATALFKNGQLDNFDVKSIQSLELDGNVDEAEFVMPVKAGVKILDQRIDKRNPQIIVVERDVKDLFYLIAY